MRTVINREIVSLLAVLVPVLAAIWVMNQGLRTELQEGLGQVRAEIQQVRTELKEDISQMRTELKEDISQMRTELKEDISQVRTELKGEINQVRTELKGEISDLRQDATSLSERMSRLEGTMAVIKDAFLGRNAVSENLL